MKNILFLSLLLLFSCDTTKKGLSMDNSVKRLSNNVPSSKSNTFTYWVNSMKVDCTGMVPMKCLQVQKGEKINPQNWEYFYSEIEGFNFEPGYQYKLMVTELKLQPDLVPADASSIKYTLVKVLEKKKVKTMVIGLLDAKWTIVQVFDKNISKLKLNAKPYITFDLKSNAINGNDGCNGFFGTIKKIDGVKISFGRIGNSNMFCEQMKISDSIGQALTSVDSYDIDGPFLTLKNEEGQQVLKLVQ